MRRASEYYPTPPCAVEALQRWAEANLETGVRHGTWLDPAAGYGALLQAFPISRRRIGIEIDPVVAAAAPPTVEMELGDALPRPWPRANVVMNPPFSAVDPFLQLMIARVRLWHTVGIALTRTSVWQTASRLGLPLPNRLLLLTWRPSFTGDGAGDSWDYAFGVYLPRAQPGCLVERLTKPAVSPRLRALHSERSQLAQACGVTQEKLL